MYASMTGAACSYSPNEAQWNQAYLDLGRGGLLEELWISKSALNFLFPSNARTRITGMAML